MGIVSVCTICGKLHPGSAKQIARGDVDLSDYIACHGHAVIGRRDDAQVRRGDSGDWQETEVNEWFLAMSERIGLNRFVDDSFKSGAGWFRFDRLRWNGGQRVYETSVMYLASPDDAKRREETSFLGWKLVGRETNIQPPKGYGRRKAA